MNLLNWSERPEKETIMEDTKRKACLSCDGGAFFMPGKYKYKLK